MENASLEQLLNLLSSDEERVSIIRRLVGAGVPVPKDLIDGVIDYLVNSTGIDQAASFAKESGRPDKAKELYALALEQCKKEQKWEGAAIYAEKAGLHSEAIIFYEILYEKYGSFNGLMTAIRIAEGEGMSTEAKRICKTLAECFKEAGRFSEALHYFERAGDEEAIKHIYAEWSEDYEKKGNLIEAAAWAKHAGMLERAEQLSAKDTKRAEKSRWSRKEKIANFFERHGLQSAARWLYALDAKKSETISYKTEDAMRLYQKAGMPEEAKRVHLNQAGNYERSGSFLAAAEIYNTYGMEDKARLVYLKQAEIEVQRGKLTAAAERYEKAGITEKAEALRALENLVTEKKRSRVCELRWGVE